MFNYLVTVFTVACAAALFLWVWPWGLVLLGLVAVMMVVGVVASS